YRAHSSVCGGIGRPCSRRHSGRLYLFGDGAATDDRYRADRIRRDRRCGWLRHAASLARPRGNATGFIVFEYAIAAKWLELLKEIAPGVTRAAVLRDSATPGGIGQFAAVQTVAPIGMELSVVGVRDSGDIEHDIAAFAREPNGGLIVTVNAFAVDHPNMVA